MNRPPETGRQHHDVIAIRQDQTQPVTRLPVGNGVVRYGYDLSHDSKVSREPGQDFLAFRHGAGRLAFAVCDGVGGSFLGNLAAQFLGKSLVEWLWAVRPFESAAQLQRELSQVLTDLVPDAREAIERYELSGSLPPLLRSVLEEKRAYGSEAMFVCGRVEWPTGGIAGSVALASSGDSELQVLDRFGGRTLLTGTTHERWSTHRGARGQIKTALLPARDVARLMAYSDGLRSLAGDLHRLADDALDRAVAQLGESPLSDDISLIDIALDARDMAPEHAAFAPRQTDGPRSVQPEPQRPVRHEERRPEAPASPRFVAPANDSVIRPGARLAWTKVPGARSYRVQQATRPTFDPDEVIEEEVSDSWLTIEADQPGPIIYRVRALCAGVESDWSSPLYVVIDM